MRVPDRSGRENCEPDGKGDVVRLREIAVEATSGGSGLNSREPEVCAAEVTATRDASSLEPPQLMAAAVVRGNILLALERVESNRGAAGV